MKKTFLFLFMLAMTLGFVACSNNDDLVEQSEQNNDKMIITASLDETTRTSLDANDQVLWSEGDEIVLYSGTIGEAGKVFKLVGGAGTTQGTFEGDKPKDGPYKAYYAITDLTLPGSQTYVANNVKNNPMYAKVTVKDGKAGNVQFKNLCGLLELTIKKDQFEKVRSIVIGADKPMAGQLKVIDNETTFSSTLSTGSQALVLDCGKDGVALTDAGVKFYFIMPENTYSSVRIQISGTDGSVSTKTLKEGMNLQITRSQITATSFTASTDKEDSHESIDLGLPSGKRWAFMNIGANSDSESGNYYAWGEISSKTNYSVATHKWGDTAMTPTKYNATDGKTQLDFLDDAAVMNWGGQWRMPTKADWEELVANCYIVYTSNYNSTNVKGHIVYKAKNDADKGKFNKGSDATKPVASYQSTQTTKKTGGFFGIGGTTTTTQADAHIFLPIAGYKEGQTLKNKEDNTLYSMYWADDLYPLQNAPYKNAYYFKCEGAASAYMSYIERYWGLPIRAIKYPATSSAK